MYRAILSTAHEMTWSAWPEYVLLPPAQALSWQLGLGLGLGLHRPCRANFNRFGLLETYSDLNLTPTLPPQGLLYTAASNHV